MTIIALFRPDPFAVLRRHSALALPLLTAIVLAMVGAFGSYVGMGLPVRLLHFIAAAVLISPLSLALSVLIQRYVVAGAAPFWTVLVVAAAVAPVGGLVMQELLRLWAPQVLPHVTYRELALQVLSINLLVGSAVWLLRQQPVARPEDRETTQAQQVAAPGTLAAFRLKLPLALRDAAILSLSAEDHYVRVRTDRGQALVLINLTDAVATMGPDAGIRIHRSHWVAHRSLRRQTKQSGRTGLQLGDNTVLPVSRAGQKLLRSWQEAEMLGN